MRYTDDTTKLFFIGFTDGSVEIRNSDLLLKIRLPKPEDYIEQKDTCKGHVTDIIYYVGKKGVRRLYVGV